MIWIYDSQQNIINVFSAYQDNVNNMTYFATHLIMYRWVHRIETTRKKYISSSIIKTTTGLRDCVRCVVQTEVRQFCRATDFQELNDRLSSVQTKQVSARV